MSSEVAVRYIVDNELEVSRSVCHEWKIQMTNAYCYLMREGAVVENIKEEFEQHNTMYEIIMGEENLHEIKRVTVCMNMFAESLFNQLNLLIATNLVAIM